MCLLLRPAMQSHAGMANRQGDVDLRFPLAWSERQLIRKGVTVHNTSRRKLSKTTRQETRRPTARPQCLVDRAHHCSSGAFSSSPSAPVAASSIPPWSSGQSTAWPAVHHRSRPTGGLVTTWQRSSTPRSTLLVVWYCSCPYNASLLYLHNVINNYMDDRTVE